MELTARVHFEDGGDWAEVKDLLGCFGSGRNLDELIEAVRRGGAALSRNRRERASAGRRRRFPRPRRDEVPYSDA